MWGSQVGAAVVTGTGEEGRGRVWEARKETRYGLGKHARRVYKQKGPAGPQDDRPGLQRG